MKAKRLATPRTNGIMAASSSRITISQSRAPVANAKKRIPQKILSAYSNHDILTFECQLINTQHWSDVPDSEHGQ
jgi:hypothetical protein